ncbi:MAG TPA: nucleoside-diphosphate sugar epimerase/dehydratase [Xanthomonadaceae bacterium]|nr:nucleoside-diphosphate sugar epimerase/dehydratase [Xanthomonadaceae bacterium]
MGRRVRAWIAGIHPRLAVVAHDLSMVWAAWMLATVARYHFWPEPPPLSVFPPEMWIVLGAQGLVLWWTGLYRGLWRFASLPDLFNIMRAAVIGALGIALGLFLFNRLEGVPRSVLLMYPVLLSVLLGAPRLLYRYWKDSRLDFSQLAPSKRVLVLGAGRAGEALVRDLRQDRHYHIVGLLDDNRSLRGAKLHGIPVLGSLEQLGDIASETAAEMLLIAMPSASNQQMQRVVEACEETGLAFRTVPRLQDVVAGHLSFNQLKEVAIEDLLGRDPVLLDWTAVRTGLSGRRVLVTGGGGSIGAELCRQVARLGAESLTVLERSEYNLYRIGQELQRDFPELLFHPVLGDVCDSGACEHVLDLSRAQVVFHAAAYKHVPLLESHAREAVRNNVLGTESMGRAAMRHGVDTFVLISTDKAVNPANVMGASKRAAERVCQRLASEASDATRFITVRFGNVLDSAGSVVPLFREQIAAGGPVTVTHPEIARYFMTIPEACQLILQAAVLGEGGEIFALDMGEPVRIHYLAEQMIRLAGKVPDKDIAIVYTGLRPGEKLFEELFHEHERYQQTRHSKIYLASPRAPFDGDLDALLRQTHAAVRSYDEARLLEVLRQLVPEFHSPREESAGRVTSIHRVAG